MPSARSAQLKKIGVRPRFAFSDIPARLRAPWRNRPSAARRKKAHFHSAPQGRMLGFPRGIMGKPLLRLALAALLAASCGGAAAAVCNSNMGGGWGTAGIWSCGAVPGAADDVTINNGHNVSLGNNRNSQNLTIAAGGTLTTGNNSITINNNG